MVSIYLSQAINTGTIEVKGSLDKEESADIAEMKHAMKDLKKVKDDAKRKKSFAKKKAKRQELLKAGKAALAQAQVADGRSYDKEASVGDKHSSASLHDSSSSTQVSVSRKR